MTQKGFIQIPLLIAIIALIIVASTGAGLVLHKQGKLVPLIANISGVLKETEDIQPETKSAELEAQEKPLILEFQSPELEEEASGTESQPKSEIVPQSQSKPQAEVKSELVETDPCINVDCPDCQYCLNGNCIARSNGYNDCGLGCQRCVNGSCQNYNLACSNCQYCSSDICVNYCQGTDTSCGCTSCVNCNSSDRWINVGSSSSCCEGNKSCTCQQQEYRDYRCLGGSCSYSVTETRTSESGCVQCGSSKSCLNGICQSNCAGTNISCGSENCMNCNNSDGWVNFISIPFPYCDGNRSCTDQKQEYRDYFCSGSSCTYSVTDTRTNKSCIECGSSEACSDGICVSKPTKTCEWIWQGTISGSSVSPFSPIINCTVEKEGSTGYILGVGSDVYPGNKYLSTSIELSPGSIVHRYLCRCK